MKGVAHWARFLLVFGLCLCVGLGCARGRKSTGGDMVGDDMLDPLDMGGEYGLADRFAEGTKIEGLNFERVQFNYDSYRIQESEFPKIEAVADYLKREGDVRLVTEGHCDERGSREYNMSLGEHRALAVRAHLIGLGVDGGRIQTRSYGEELPLDMGHGEGAWMRNRRVEWALYR